MFDLRSNFRLQRRFIMTYNQKLEIGIEDIKLFHYENVVYFVGNIKKIKILKFAWEFISYLKKKINILKIYNSPFNNLYEKNWIPFLNETKN